MSDVVERAEALLNWPVWGSASEISVKRCNVMRDLVAELKAARAEIESLAAKLGVS